MTAVFHVDTVTSPSDTGALGLYSALVAWLVAVGPLTLIDVDVWRENSPSFSGLQRARILYSVGGSTDSTWAVNYYRSGSIEQTDPTKNASQQFNDAVYAGQAINSLFFVDITEYGMRYASAETFLVFGVNTAASLVRASALTSLLGQPLANILAGASGTVTLLDATGATLGTATVKNVGLTTWQANQRSYVTADPVSGLWIGISTGVTTTLTPLAPPAVTTTTAPAASTYIAQTKPVG